MTNQKGWMDRAFCYYMEIQEQVMIEEAHSILLRWSILPHKAAFVRQMRRLDNLLGLLTSMRITSDLQDGMSDSGCVYGVVGLILTGLLFCMMVTAATYNPLVTFTDALIVLLLSFAFWVFMGIAARVEMEARHMRNRRRDDRGVARKLHVENDPLRTKGMRDT
ncbi:hypothetical protein GQ607_014918 [Colletotrichum asianum]|uniref:Uncharacterized protein n=1 Tax=Colletotrichum asianum TaxID=702518 RepID=A0A8H3W114_9PEZI|nr:hypothetical protein GQ607_014918 [Colletotrichum asianum]